MVSKLIVIIILSLGVVYLLLNYVSKFQKADVTVNKVTVKPSVTVTKKTALDSLKNRVELTLSGTEGTYAVAIKNFKTGESFNLNEHKVFIAASLYKNWIMAETFNQISKGDINEDQILSQSISVLNDEFNISEEDAELKEGTVTMRVKEALEKMITVSDNYAALLLSEKIRFSRVSSYLQKHGFNESSLGVPPKTTVYDTALFYEKLYRGELADQVYTTKMLDLLKKQQRKGGLPKYLPPNTEIAHKTGELGSVKHDGGIVFSNRGDYIIVVMSETGSQSAAAERIANISKTVYEYFN